MARKVRAQEASPATPQGIRRIPRNEAPAPEPAGLPPVVANDMVTAHRWGWYLMSLIVPFAGIFIGLFLYDMESREVRRVGRYCLLTGFAVWVLFPVLILSAMVLMGAFTLVGWMAEMAPGY